MGDDGDIVFDSVDDPVQSNSMQKAQVSDTAVVQLLTATRVPAGHQKLVKAKVNGWLSEGFTLSTPTVVDSNLKIVDAIV